MLRPTCFLAKPTLAALVLSFLAAAFTSPASAKSTLVEVIGNWKIYENIDELTDNISYSAVVLSKNEDKSSHHAEYHIICELNKDKIISIRLFNAYTNLINAKVRISHRIDKGEVIDSYWINGMEKKSGMAMQRISTDSGTARKKEISNIIDKIKTGTDVMVVAVKNSKRFVFSLKGSYKAIQYIQDKCQ